MNILLRGVQDTHSRYTDKTHLPTTHRKAARANKTVKRQQTLCLSVHVYYKTHPPLPIQQPPHKLPWPSVTNKDCSHYQ